MPNIALLPKIEKSFDNIFYIGTAKGIEHEIVRKYKNIRYYSIDAVKLIRKFTLKNLLIPFRLIKSINQCKKILKDIQPNIVFSKGGFVAVPVVIACHMLKIPVLAHESDSTMGLANKIIYKFCDKMFFSFKEAMNGYEKKGIYSGSPVREEFLNRSKNKISVQINPNKPTILVVGGSLGAKTINEAIVNALPELQNYNVINIVGKGNIDNNVIYKNYFQIEFTNNISDLYKTADIIISRAGSNVIFELLATNKPMILIPLPKDISRGDQIINAKIFEKKGYAKVLQQKDLNTKSILENLNYIIHNKLKYIKKMQNNFDEINGVEVIFNQIIKY